jgi:hypothetical protein
VVALGYTRGMETEAPWLCVAGQPRENLRDHARQGGASARLATSRVIPLNIQRCAGINGFQ